MMTCRDAENWIQRSLDGALTPKERQTLDDHLAQCAGCRDAWEQYRRMAKTANRWVAQGGEETADEAAFVSAVMGQIAPGSEAVTRPVWRRWYGWAACAGVVALIGASTLVWPHVDPWLAQGKESLPPAPSVSALSNGSLSMAHDLSEASAHSFRSLTQGIPLPFWAAEALVLAVCVNLWLLIVARGSRQKGQMQ